MAYESMEAFRNRVAEYTSAVSSTIADQAVNLNDLFSSKKTEYKDFMEQYLKVKLAEKAKEWIETLPKLAKDNVEDPDMPGFVRRAIHNGIDSMWPDIRAELMWEIEVMVDGNEEEYSLAVEAGGKPNCVLAFFRYHLFPYDKSIWACLKDPVYLIANILALVPTYGIYAYMYVFFWAIIDRTDEYQLVYFILSFKGAQFFSWGLFKGIIGYTRYFVCTTFPDITELVNATAQNNITTDTLRRTESTCKENGPGVVELYWVLIVSWLLPLLLVWISLLLLPCSKDKGRSKLKILEEAKKNEGQEGASNLAESDEKLKKQGGYIRRMLIFDMVIFLLCVGLMIVMVALQPETGKRSKWMKLIDAQVEDFQVLQTLYFCQFLYGVCSIVFVPFNIPILQAILTHSAPTGYNMYGQCCKFKGPEKPKRKPSSLSQGELDTHEVEGIMDNFKSIAAGKGANWDVIKRRRTGLSEGAPGTPGTSPKATQSGLNV